MTATLLGCPHCGRPVGSAPQMAGQAVGCPYCRRPFQMPAPPPEKSPAPKPDTPPSIKDSAELPAPAPRVADPVAFVRRLATVFACTAAGGVLVTAVLVILAIVLPLWRNAAGEFAISLRGSLWLAAVILFTVAGVALCFVIRGCVVVGLKSARNRSL